MIGLASTFVLLTTGAFTFAAPTIPSAEAHLAARVAPCPYIPPRFVIRHPGPVRKGNWLSRPTQTTIKTPISVGAPKVEEAGCVYQIHNRKDDDQYMMRIWQEGWEGWQGQDAVLITPPNGAGSRAVEQYAEILSETGTLLAGPLTIDGRVYIIAARSGDIITHTTAWKGFWKGYPAPTLPISVQAMKQCNWLFDRSVQKVVNRMVRYAEEDGVEALPSSFDEILWTDNLEVTAFKHWTENWKPMQGPVTAAKKAAWTNHVASLPIEGMTRAEWCVSGGEFDPSAQLKKAGQMQV